MRSRFAALVRVSFLSLFLTTVVFGLDAVTLVGASVANAGLSDNSLGSAQPLRALLSAQQAKLTAADGTAEDWFGLSVAISGDTAVVGAPSDNVGATVGRGSAYVFVRNGNSWIQEAQLTAANGAAGDAFGHSVAIAGETVVVGAPSDNVGANADQGSAYVFGRSGTGWSQEAHLTATDGAAGDTFGTSAAIFGDTILAGAPGDDVGVSGDRGSAYVFVRSGTVWSQQAQLTAAYGLDFDYFGCSVAISGETAVVGAENRNFGSPVIPDRGTAYVLVRNGATWTEQAQLFAADGAASDYFGNSVAISGDTLVVAAYGDDIGAGSDQGSAYVFTRIGSTWSQRTKLTAADRADGDIFGVSVAMSNGFVVVGASGADVGVNYGQGSAYVFARSGSTWSQHAKLVAADGAGDKAFGCSVSISGETALVGAHMDDVGGNENQGSAYVFAIKPGKPVAKSPKGLISSRRPTFRWTATAGAATYKVRIYRGSRLIKKKTGVTTTFWKCTTRLPRHVYLTWKVRAWNDAGSGLWSAKPRFKVR